MARPYTFRFSALGSQSWTVPDDGTIVGLQSINTGMSLSWDKAAIFTDLSTPAANLAETVTIASSPVAGFQVPLNIPVEKNQTLMVVAKGQGSAVIYLEPNVDVLAEI